MGSRSALLSAFLRELIAKLATPAATKFLKRHNQANRLKESLRSFDAVVDDAEKKQFGVGGDATNIRKWLTELQHTLYLLEQLLDEITVQSMDGGHNTKWLETKIRRFLPTSNPPAKIRPGFRQIMEQLEKLLQTKDSLGLTERATQAEDDQEFVQKSASSIVAGQDHFYGREEEMMGILDFLLSKSDNTSSGTVVGNTCVIGIVGVAGIGKTTLARLVYNNYRAKLCFGVREWVSVSQVSSAGKLAEKILNAFTRVTTVFSHNDDLELLRTDL